MAQGNGEKILVAYFSHTGNTRHIANQIHQSEGGGIFEIQAVKRSLLMKLAKRNLHPLPAKNQWFERAGTWQATDRR